jgi:geranylgeranyl diphosphate synthase type I
MSFRETLALYAADINAQLDAILPDMAARAAAVHAVGAELIGIVADFTTGSGKRLRPVLMRVAYEGLGGTDTPGVMRAFCALELLQSFFLMHDDIMDRSDLRRGRPTVHREYAARYRHQVRDADHFGQAMGILAGDVAAQQAVLLLVQSRCAPERIAGALRRCAEINLDVCYGQALDMILSERPLGSLTEQEVLCVAEYKTARYTTELPLHLAAILAGASEDLLPHLSAYAVPVGIAFQLRDDLLGVFGDEVQTGKPVHSDLQEGKQTLLILRAWEGADGTQRSLLKRVLGNAQATEEDLDGARQVIVSTGARAAVLQQVESLVQEAKAALARVSFAPQMTEFLAGLADYVIERER